MNDHAYFNLVLKNHHAQLDRQALHEREWHAQNRRATLSLSALATLLLSRLPRLRSSAPIEPCTTC